ncbi:hypothetical protein CupriaWKF_18835 [Cupriavidus sp. WKF15]|uniref:hypothetical protein n=1 Tax=Cupriavidus sp. WKF15 TaxID=3032282 RepID=UPI0023E194E1|nr:hypothetical protein [Cupriavidus sp. WKF15]WER49219.1 hypothetical protein CupriaWKF_18835 [Cupriavidus sp. WKF15]
MSGNTVPQNPQQARRPATARGDALQRVTGYRGDRFEKHRAMRRLAFPLTRWIDVLLLPAFLTYAFCMGWPWVADLWRRVIGFWSVALGAEVSLRADPALLPAFGTVPYAHANAALPTPVQWLCGMAITLVLLFGTRWLTSGRALPLAYGLRLVGLIQASAQAYFYFWPASFPYDAGKSIASLTQASVLVILITPWLYALIYNVLDFGFLRKLLLSATAMAYLVVLVPLQYTLTASSLLHFSVLWYPLVFLLGSIFVQFGTLVALYAWAMSWRPRN